MKIKPQTEETKIDTIVLNKNIICNYDSLNKIITTLTNKNDSLLCLNHIVKIKHIGLPEKLKPTITKKKNYYKVLKKDTWYSISKKFNIDINKLRKLNQPITNLKQDMLIVVE